MGRSSAEQQPANTGALKGYLKEVVPKDSPVERLCMQNAGAADLPGSVVTFSAAHATSHV